MGLSASQARLLTLTARQHSIEYKAQRLEAQKLQLANESDKVYNDYLAKLDATKIKYKQVESDGSIYYDDATFTKLASSKFLFNVNGQICKDKAEVISAMKSEYDIDISAEDSYTLLTTLVSEGYVVLMEVSDESDITYRYDSASGKIQKIDDSGNWVDYGDINDVVGSDTEKAIYKVYKDTSVATSTKVQEVSDELNLKKAEAQYEADMNRINVKDSRYDTELAQLETERNAIKQEIDTLKTVAKDNVDRTFKIFT